MANKSKTKKERIEKLEEQFISLSVFVCNMETRIGNMQNEICDVDVSFNRQRSRIENLEKKTPSYFVMVAVAIVSIIVSVVSLFMVKDANKKIYELQEKVNAKQVTESIQTNATDEFINALLPSRDQKLYDGNGNTFYFDSDCKYAINNPEFCTNEYVYGHDSSGNLINIYRLTNGDFAYIMSGFSVNLRRTD